MGTVTRREMPARLHTLRRLLTLPKGVREVISEMSAVNLELLCTGTDVGKEAAGRVMRMMGREQTNRASLIRARAVKPLVKLLQNAHDALRDEAAAAPSAAVARPRHRVGPRPCRRRSAAER